MVREALEEDLPALAEYEFRVAQRACAACREYHGLFGYARLSRLRDGLKIDADIVTSLIDRFVPAQGRILIAGSADAGLLALTCRAARGKSPRITVADRCATPLAVCRHYLDANRLEAATLQADLTQAALPERYDVILAHNILPFIDPARRVAFLSNLAGALAQGGTLLFADIVKPVKPDGTPVYKKPDNLMAALAAEHVTLPEDEISFARRVQSLAETERVRSSSGLDLARFEAFLAAAGLRVRERIDHDRRKTQPSRDGGEATIIHTHFFVASVN